MESLRTSEVRFASLPDFPYSPHYQEVDDFEGGKLRLAYIDEGPRDARPILLFHGEPTWSYIYRKMIPHLLAAGLRVLAPDLIGMGRSDKPTLREDYTYERHIRWMRAWVSAVDVKDAIWFGQDWGSMIGLAVVCLEPERFSGIVLANGLMPDPENMARFAPAYMKSPDPQAFGRWQEWIKNRVEIDCGEIVAYGVPSAGVSSLQHQISPAERAAYNAPFPDKTYQTSVLVFPFLFETIDDGGRRLLSECWRVLEKWEKPLVTAYGKKDPVLGWADEVFHAYVPGAKGQPHKTFPKGNHFIQEDEPEALAATIVDLARRL